MPFYIYHNKDAHTLKIHKAECFCCNEGQGRRNDSHGFWLPEGNVGYNTYHDAQFVAQGLENELQIGYTNCEHCDPQI